MVDKPFSKDYVLRVTTKNMKKAVDISIKKTMDRIQGFDGNNEKSNEVFQTLSTLHTMRRQLDDISEQYKGK